MEVRVKLFTVLKEKAAREEILLAMSKGSSCREVLLRLKSLFGFSDSILERSLVAINGVYADRSTVLTGGEEIAILPPVSGG